MEADKQDSVSWLRFNLTGVTLIFVLLLIATLPSIITNTFGAIVTLSINSVTESLQLALKAERTYSWRLPPGTFAMLSGGGDGCLGKEPDLLCVFAQNSTLRVSGGPSMTLESAPGSKFLLSLVPLDNQPMTIEILDPNGNKVAETKDLTYFESAEKTPETRLPVIAEQVKLGALLHESSAAMGPDDTIWQPMLLEGGYSVFANVGSNRERLQILQGEFDSGDVIDVRAQPDDESESVEAAIWGHVSISPVDDSDVLELRAILHTPHPELNVRRFGAAKGYTIKTRPWQIYSKLPFWQSSWIIFVSLLLIYDVYCAAAERNHSWNRHMSGLMTWVRGVKNKITGAGENDDRSKNPQSDAGRSDA